MINSIYPITPPNTPTPSYHPPPPQVAVYDGRATYTSAPLSCPNSQTPGTVTLRGKGVPVTCTYRATGLAISDGAVLPIIITDAAPAPAPANPVAYSVASAPRNIVGDCADVGSALVLDQGSKRAPWQPAFVGQALGSGSDCEGGNTQRFSLWFGADPAGVPNQAACGDYSFAGTLTVVPTNGDAVTSEADFGVQVNGCKRRLRWLRLV